MKIAKVGVPLSELEYNYHLIDHKDDDDYEEDDITRSDAGETLMYSPHLHMQEIRRKNRCCSVHMPSRKKCVGFMKRHRWFFIIPLLVLFSLLIYVTIAIVELRKIGNAAISVHTLYAPPDALCSNPAQLRLGGTLQNPSYFGLGIQDLKVSFRKFKDDPVSEAFASISADVKFGESHSRYFANGNNSFIVDMDLSVHDFSRLGKLFRSVLIEVEDKDRVLELEVSATASFAVMGFPVSISKSLPLRVSIDDYISSNNSNESSIQGLVKQISFKAVEDVEMDVLFGVSVRNNYTANINVPPLIIEVNVTSLYHSSPLGLFRASVPGFVVNNSKGDVETRIRIQNGSVDDLRTLLRLYRNYSNAFVDAVLVRFVADSNDNCLLRQVLSSINPVVTPMNISAENSHERIMYDFVSSVEDVSLEGIVSNQEFVLHDADASIRFGTKMLAPNISFNVDVQSVKFQLMHSLFENISVGSIFLNVSSSQENVLKCSIRFISTQEGQLLLNQSFQSLVKYWSGQGYFYVRGLAETGELLVINSILDGYILHLTKDSQVISNSSLIRSINTTVQEVENASQKQAFSVTTNVEINPFLFDSVSDFDPHSFTFMLPDVRLYSQLGYESQSLRSAFGNLSMESCTVIACFGHCSSSIKSQCVLRAVIFEEAVNGLVLSPLTETVGSVFNRNRSVCLSLSSSNIEIGYSFPKIQHSSERTTLLNSTFTLLHPEYESLAHIPCVFFPGITCPYSIPKNMSATPVLLQGSDMKLDLGFSASFPVYFQFTHLPVIDLNFQDLMDFHEFDSILQVKIRRFELSWPEEYEGFAKGYVVSELIWNDLTGFQRALQIYLNSQSLTRAFLTGSSRSNKISSIMSEVVIEKVFNPSGNSSMSYYLTSTTLSSATMNIVIPVNVDANLTLNIGNFRMIAEFSNDSFLSGSSAINFKPGVNNIEVKVEWFHQNSFSIDCLNFYSNDKRCCSFNMILNKIIDVTNVYGVDLPITGELENHFGEMFDVMTTLTLNQSPHVVSKREFPSKPDEGFSLSEALKVHPLHYSDYFRTAGSLAKAYLTGKGEFDVSVELEISNNFNVSLILWEYSLDVYLVDPDPTSRHWPLVSKVYAPNLKFPLVTGISQDLNRTRLLSGEKANLSIVIPVAFENISEKLVRLYDEVVSNKRFCADFEHIQVKIGLQASDEDPIFNSTIAVNYRGASLVGNDDCSRLFVCQANMSAVFSMSTTADFERGVIGGNASVIEDGVEVIGKSVGQGTFFYGEKVVVSGNWKTSFEFQIDCEVTCADGFSVILQTQERTPTPSCSMMSSSKYCHGYRGISSSYEIIFDAIMFREIAFALNGDEPSYIKQTSMNFADSNVHFAEIAYDAIREQVDVYIDGIHQATDYIGVSFFNQTESAWVGFGARSGYSGSARLHIYDWQYNIDQTDPSYTELEQDDQVVGTAGSEFILSILTYDSCKHRRLYGGEFWQLKVGASNQSWITATDEKNGIYSIQTSQQSSGKFEIFARNSGLGSAWISSRDD